MLLNVDNVSKSFGGVQAVHNVTLAVGHHSMVSIIGPNGAGKTTLFNLISGVYKQDSGSILLNGSHIEGMPLNKITHKGIARTFQNIRLFRGLTVLENILTSCDCVAKYNIIDGLFNTPRRRRIDKENMEACMCYLEQVGIQDYRNERPENLPYGIQRKVELARALAVKPKLLMLDEPAAGLNLKEVKDFIDLIQNLYDSNEYSILIIEHRMAVVNKLSQWIYVLNFGEMLAEGAPQDIQKNLEVINAYIGKED